MNPENLRLCARLWPERPACTTAEFDQMMDACARLLNQRRVFGRILLDDQDVHAYGVSCFVHEAFGDDYLRCPHPLMGKRLLLESPPTTILTGEQIGERNANEGLQLVVLSTTYDQTRGNSPAVLGALMQAFFDNHRGYRIRRLVHEGIGEPAVTLAKAGNGQVVGEFAEIAPGVSIRSAVVTMDREYAASRTSPNLALFVYSPPKVFFTSAEQELFLAALDGAPDDVISTRLGVPLTAVKARWNRIQSRIAERLPGLLREMACHGDDRGRRGRQFRHVIVEYVRENPSELTPYGRKQATRPTASRPRQHSPSARHSSY